MAAVYRAPPAERPLGTVPRTWVRPRGRRGPGRTMPEEQWPVRGEDAYTILGVSPDSDDEAIAAAYRSLARRHHPDIAGEDATRRMSRINAAWDLLRDPTKREA